MFLSIIIPVYNAQKTLPKCLDSIWCQGIPEEEYEVICVDDCSSDDSCVYISEQTITHSNLRLLRNTSNKRAGGARNEGVSAAKGEYILFIDSDDYYHSGSLVKLIKLQKENHYDILMANSSRERFDCPSDKGVHANNENVYSGRDFILNNTLPNSPWKYMFRRSLMVDNGIWFEERVAAEDIDWIFKLTLAAKSVRYADILLVHYVVNPLGQTQKVNFKNIHDTCKAALRLQRLAHQYETDEQISSIILTHSQVYWIAVVKRLCRFFAPTKTKSTILKPYFNSIDMRLLNSSRILNRVNEYPVFFSFISNLMVVPIYLYSRIKRI